MEDTAVSSGDTARGRATPVHLWVVGLLATLWDAFGAYDYIMTRTENVDYLRKMMPNVDPAVTLAWVDSISVIPSAGWALGVWGGLVGSLLLLLRSRHSVAAYLLSAVGAIVSFAFQFFGPNRPPAELADPVMPVVIIAVTIGLFLYARAMRQKGVLA
ncbi:hypothetical protein H9L12_09845 [Sphingomonas rhizophila]|uniref:Uncharacterized protein n=1 Tax=Sphingomonas rhizophila TaxID=2071607 RepID=A0A7G9S9R9_9SPHN|nr:hypothetical protein [Sphingomonas rhizophila]QNN64594.1 hypothetical protein H9L12_09845 [Sphingomonas rhizophila]